MAQVESFNKPTVRIDGDSVVFNGFRETDAEVVQMLTSAADVEAAAHSCIQVGARAVRLAQVSVDTSLVDSRFERLATEFDGKLAEVASAIAERAASLLGEEGELAATLTRWRQSVEVLFEETFDPDSRRSAIAKIRGAMDEAAADMTGVFRRLIDPDSAESPLASWHGDLARCVKEQGEATLGAVRDLSERIAVAKAQADVMQMTAVKGFSYEDVVHGIVGPLVAPFGDVAEQVGALYGAAGSKSGDEVVRLSPEDVAGADARYVLEAKDRKVGLRLILQELQDAMQNREALAGVAVFSRQANSPAAVPVQFYDNRAIVVMEREDGTNAALRLALMWARWTVRRRLCSEGQADAARLGAMLEDGRRALQRLAAIRRAHAGARRGVDEAAAQVDAMVREVQEAFDALEAEVGR